MHDYGDGARPSVGSPKRNFVEEIAVATIDRKRRLATFLGLLVWEFGRQNSRRRKTLTMFRQVTQGIRPGGPGSIMEGAPANTLDQARSRLVRSLAKSAQALSVMPGLPEANRADFARFADVLRRQGDGEGMTPNDLINGLAAIIGQIGRIDTDTVQ